MDSSKSYEDTGPFIAEKPLSAVVCAIAALTAISVLLSLYVWYNSAFITWMLVTATLALVVIVFVVYELNTGSRETRRSKVMANRTPGTHHARQLNALSYETAQRLTNPGGPDDHRRP